MFDVLPMLYTTVTMNGRGAPFFEIVSSNKLKPGSFPAGALPSILAKGGGAFEYQYVEPHPKRNYVMQWNLNVQRQLAPNLTALVGYLGSRGVHQAFRSDDANIVLPTQTSAGYVWPVPIGSGTTINPNTDTVGAIRFLDGGGDSFYNALQVGVQKRMSHGLQIQGSYTWGKSIDEGSGVTAGDSLSNAIGSLPWYDLKSIRGLSDYNIGRVFVINGTWDLPTLKSAPAVLGWAVNGWELGGILKVSDGPPFTPTFGRRVWAHQITHHPVQTLADRVAMTECNTVRQAVSRKGASRVTPRDQRKQLWSAASSGDDWRRRQSDPSQVLLPARLELLRRRKHGEPRPS